MDRKGKGKMIAGKGSSSSGGKKRKGGIEFRDEGLKIDNKRKKAEVLQFFEESAEVGYYGESSDEDCDLDDFLNDMEVEPEAEASGKDEKAKKSNNSSYVEPKEEEINEDEFDRIMEERYKPGSGFLRYADDDVKDSIELDALVPTARDPPLWKVKCAIGRERHSVFCLMHKFAELRKIGTKLQILSVFAAEHVKGFIFIEADKEHEILEACKNLNGIYATRMMLVPKAEAPQLLTVQKKTKKYSEGKWANVKSGKYKGDLAQVVAVSDSRKKALIKLIPRIDILALTQKYGGGRGAAPKSLNPAPRLISSSELEEFRPIIQVRRDRDTGITFEHLDSLMLKDGYLYKKVSLESLSWGVIPSKEEMLKFVSVERNETGDVEWISEIYGEEKEKKALPTGKGGGKGETSGDGTGEGSSGSKADSSDELYKLVCFSRKDFGLIVGVDEKGDGYKVLKEGSDGPVVVTVGKKEMLNAPFDSKFAALDMNNKQISISDVVKISKGPSEGKQGIVKQIYRGVIFLYDESMDENGGYFCCKSQSCEKVKLFSEEPNDKTGGFDASAFGDSVSSPKSPLSPEKEWQPREKYINSNQGEKGSMYSLGQKLRIRVGPLKGYLCRVIALRYSDVTVKLDSQHKVFTVKSEHLAEVRDRNTVLSNSGDAGTGSFQPFDMLGTDGSSGDWAKGASTSGEAGGNWNIGGGSTDLNSWGSKPTSDVSQLAVPDDNNSTWANAAAENKSASTGDCNSWGKTPTSEVTTAGGWGNAGASKVEASSWGKPGASNVEELGSWGKQGGSSVGNNQAEDSRWGKLVEDYESSQKKEESSWGKKVGSESSWGNKDGNSSASNKDGVSWGQQDKGSDGSKEGSAWGNQSGGFGSVEKKDGSSGWNKSAEDSNANSKGILGCKPDGGSSWGKQDKGGSSGVEPDGGSSWGKQGGAASWSKKDDGGSSWGKKDDGNKNDSGSSWGKKDGGGSSWGKKDDSNKNDGGSSWGKKDDGGSSWVKKDDGGSTWAKKDDGGSNWAKKDDGGSSWGKKDDGGSSWGKNDGGGSSWAKKDGGSSWGKKDDGGNSEQTFDRGGRGFGGRRGGGRRGGRDQFGRGRSFGNSEDPTPWSKSGGGSSWGKQDSGGGGSSWGKQNDTGGGSSWGKQNDAGGGTGSAWGKQNDSGGGSSWGKQNDSGGDTGSAWGKQNDTSGGGSSWGKQNDSGGGSRWGKQNDTGGSGTGSAWGKQSDTSGGGSSWGKQNDSGGGSNWGKKDSGGGGSSWGKPNDAGGGSSWGKQDGGGSGSTWGKQNDTNGGGSSWGKQNDSGGGSSWGKQDGGGGGSSWGKQDGGGGSTWSKHGDGGSKPWEEQSGGRGGFGGRRGGGFRGGFRGGRNQGGRDGGRSFDRDQSSGWKRNNTESTWKSDQSGGGSDWKKGPSDSSSGGGGNWSSWDTNSKKEINAGNETKAAAWGTGNDQANTGNNNDGGWNKKPSDDVKTSGEADNAWGSKTNAGPSASSGSAWGTGSDQANAGNNNDGGWNKKPSDDVKPSGEADNAWGSKTNAGTSASSGSAWGTGNDQANAGNNNDGGWNKKPSDDVKPSGEADNAWGSKTNGGSSGSAW